MIVRVTPSADTRTCQHRSARPTRSSASASPHHQASASSPSGVSGNMNVPANAGVLQPDEPRSARTTGWCTAASTSSAVKRLRLVSRASPVYATLCPARRPT